MEKNKILSVFSFEYWRTAALELKNLRSLTFAALAVALSIIMHSFFIPVGESLRIQFSFLAMSTGAMIYGPVAGILAGAVSDILGFFLFPSGAFFPGYTLSAMLGAFIYGIFLYKSRISILRIFLSKLFVNYVVNVGFGSLWSAVLFSKGYIYYFAKSIVKNTLMLPIEVVMLTLLFGLLLPLLERSGMIPEQGSKHIPFI